MTERELAWPELLVRLQAGPQDEPAWQCAWQEAWRRLESYARGLLGSGQNLDAASAEDVVQQTLVKLLESPAGLSKLDPAGHPEVYLKTAIRNTARDLARRKVMVLKALRHLAEMRLRAELSAAGPEKTTAALTDALAALTESQFELLRMRYWEGLSLRDIAQRLEEPYSRVAVRFFRLLKQLKNQLNA